MEYPTPEEEYELMYADELQAMKELEAENDMCFNEINQPVGVAPPQRPPKSTQPTTTTIENNHHTPTTAQFKSLQTSIKNKSITNSLFSNSIIESPQLSQIPLDPVLVQINRKLFGTPQHHTKQTRPSSTPNRDLSRISSQLSQSALPLAEPLPDSQTLPDSQPLPNAQTSPDLQPLVVSQPTIPMDTINIRKRRLEDLFGDIQDIEREERDFNYLDIDIDNDNDDDDDADADHNAHDNGLHYERRAKKMKTQEEIDNDMIKKIIVARKRYRMDQKHQIYTNRSQYLNNLDAQSKFKRKNLALIVPNFPFITIRRNYDNLRIYVRMHSEEYEDNEIMNIKCEKNLNKLFNGGDYGDNANGDDDEDEIQHQMWLDANKIIEDKLIADSKKDNNNKNGNDIQEIFTNDELTQSLWVEKYRPKRYVDLLSDETTNRSLLLWLKMWDKIVFNREFKTNPQNPQSGINNQQQQHQQSAPKYQQHQQQWTKSSEQRNTFNKRTGKFEQNGGWRKKSERTALKLDIDEYGRPIQKIALLCGPPGLGKTTLAHTIARHAGYAVREVNASDDRNLDAFKQTLENCTQMNSILTKEKRPNCIILDEIDGAPQTSIDYLIRFVNDTIGTTGGQNAVKSKGGKGKANHHILKRPIICICNDMYTPALRQLRQMALVVNFPPMESERLAERLEYISRNERIITDMTSLLTLSEKTGNDVRSCLAMLQFYNAIRKPLTIVDVLNSNVGQKDRHKNLFNVWTSIFQIHRPYKSINDKHTDTISMTDSTLTSRMNNVLDAVHLGGDFERILNGVFENYLTQKMPDPNMHGVAEATDWFCFIDRIQSKINKEQNYDIYPYLPYGFVAWHYLFASLAWPKINFPTKGYEFSQKSTLHKMTYNSLRKGFSVNCSNGGGIGSDGSTIILDSIPFLKIILNPALRSVSLQLLTPKEQHDLRHTVNIMVDLGLAYTQIKSIDGKFIYQMEPDIENLCKFKEVGAAENTEQKLSYWGRQLIAREVELEKIKRALPKITKQQQQQPQPQQPRQKQQDTSKFNHFNNKQKSTQLTFDKNGQIGTINKSTTINVEQQNTSPELPNFKKQLKPKKINQAVKETITKDFFGRITTKEKIVTVKEGGTDEIIKSPIWYRYKEGFNNAVRKDVTISSLL